MPPDLLPSGFARQGHCCEWGNGHCVLHPFAFVAYAWHLQIIMGRNASSLDESAKLGKEVRYYVYMLPGYVLSEVLRHSSSKPCTRLALLQLYADGYVPISCAGELGGSFYPQLL